eukprot:5487476-Pleurochrysis_carterae.AAC.2
MQLQNEIFRSKSRTGSSDATQLGQNAPSRCLKRPAKLVLPKDNGTQGVSRATKWYPKHKAQIAETGGMLTDGAAAGLALLGAPAAAGVVCVVGPTAAAGAGRAGAVGNAKMGDTGDGECIEHGK